MDYFTTRNTVMLALAQTWVIVACVLSAGAYCKCHTEVGIPLPRIVEMYSEYGCLALIVPVVWAARALWAMRRSADIGLLDLTAFYAGFLILLLLFFFAWFGTLQYWWRVINPCGLE